MTTKEIAESVGKDISTIQRWIKKMNGKMQSIDGKMQSSTSSNPADFNLEETCQIIETGLGKNAADLFRMSANNKAPSTDARIDRLESMVEKLCIAVATLPQTIQAIAGSQIKQPEKQQIAVPVPALPPLDPRDELNMIARDAGAAMGDYREPYNQIYKHAYYRLGIDIRKRAKNRGIPAIDYADQEGLIGDLVLIARDLFNK